MTRTIGDWITLKAGESQKIEIVISDNPSTGAHFILMVQVKGVEYPEGVHGGSASSDFQDGKTFPRSFGYHLPRHAR